MLKSKKWPLALILMGLFLGACSNNHKKAQVEADAVTDSAEASTDFLVDAEEDLFFDDHFSFEEGAEQTADSSMAIESSTEPDPLVFEEERAGAMYVANTDSEAFSEEFMTYTFKPGDTLMWVAFSIYGDYRKWKEIKEWNPDMKLSGLGEGTVIRYKAPKQVFEWRPAGLPHLVKRGETLGLISDMHYGTVKRWREIYENNQPLIRDPNLIFAGFTLYYVPDRDIASERENF